MPRVAIELEERKARPRPCARPDAWPEVLLSFGSVPFCLRVTQEALKNRLDGYHKQTIPVLDHYAPNGIVKQVCALVREP